MSAPRSSGSTAAHTQSGCCSMSRPKRIGTVWRGVLRRKRRAGWYSTAGTISDCTAVSPSRLRSARNSPANTRPSSVEFSPSTE